MDEKYLNNSEIILRLHDGRRLGAATTGKAGGYPVFHFHGSGSSRLEASLMAPLAERHGLLLIGLDRPGYGLSDYTPGARILDWPADVLEAADQLRIGTFAVDGISAGGAYALACAYQIPERLTSCTLISSVPPANLVRQAGTPWTKFTWSFGVLFPGLFRQVLRLYIKDRVLSLEAVETMLLKPSRLVAEADRKLLQDPILRTGIARAYMESLRSGGQGDRDGIVTFMGPWGFTPQQVRFEKIFLWHGEDDRIVPVAPARLLAQQLPHCSACFYPGEGHYSVMVNHAEEILHALIGTMHP